MVRIVAAALLGSWPLLAFVVAWRWPHAELGYAGVVAIGATILLACVVACRRRIRSSWATGLALALAATATLVARESGEEIAATSGAYGTWPTIDLTEQPWPDDGPRFAEVRGYLRPQWRLAEYAVAHGERPDENGPARAVLVPLVGSTADKLVLRGQVVIARVPPELVTDEHKLVTVRGITAPLDAALLEALVATQGIAQPHGVLLDALTVHERTGAWWQLAVAALLGIVAATGFTRSLRRR